MIDIPFDPEQPPVEPPRDVPQPLLWSVSRQVYGDHDVPDDDGRPMVPCCQLCDEPWPCRARRTAEHGLLAACRGERRQNDRDRHQDNLGRHQDNRDRHRDDRGRHQDNRERHQNDQDDRERNQNHRHERRAT